MSANVESMAFVGKTPWHGLGVKIEPTLTVEQVLKAAKLDWTVSAETLSVRGKPCDQFKALVRDDNDYPLGYCGPRYTPIQNHEAFSFFKSYLEAGNLHLETAGSLDRGRWVWGLAKLHESFELEGGDKVESYMLLSHPHQWGKAGVFMFTPIRVVCMNTLNMALGEKNMRKKSRFLHFKGWSEDTKNRVERDLGLAKELMLDFRDKAALMSSAMCKESELIRYLAELVMPAKDLDVKVAQLKLSATTRRLIELTEQSPGADLKSARGTWWGAYNAFSYFTDHEAGGEFGSSDRRLSEAWFGRRGLLKRQAFESAVQRAKETLALTA